MEGRGEKGNGKERKRIIKGRKEEENGFGEERKGKGQEKKAKEGIGREGEKKRDIFCFFFVVSFPFLVFSAYRHKLQYRLSLIRM